MTSEVTGVLLFAHGARDAAWARPFEAVAAGLRAAAPGLAVALAYLELMAPDLPTAAAALAAQGCRRVTVLPLFLGPGGHVRRDLPALVAGLRLAHPDTVWRLAPPVGEDEGVIEAMVQAARARAIEP